MSDHRASLQVLLSWCPQRRVGHIAVARPRACGWAGATGWRRYLLDGVSVMVGLPWLAWRCAPVGAGCVGRLIMPDSGQWFAVGLDSGGTAINATVIDSAGRFLVTGMVESPSCVLDGPDKAIEALARSLDHVLEVTGIEGAAVRAV